MIDIIDSIISTLGEIEELGGRVYRRWPRKDVTMPAALVSHMGRMPILTDEDGTEIQTSLTYSIDINARDQETTDRVTEKAINALARYNMHTSGHVDFYDDQLRVYRSILTVGGLVDIRGNTFTQS